MCIICICVCVCEFMRMCVCECIRVCYTHSHCPLNAKDSSSKYNYLGSLGGVTIHKTYCNSCCSAQGANASILLSTIFVMIEQNKLERLTLTNINTPVSSLKGIIDPFVVDVFGQL